MRSTIPDLDRCLTLKTCGWLIAALFLAQVPSLCTSAQAQCVLDPVAQAQLQQSPGASGSDQLTVKAFVEADIPSCTDQAIVDSKMLSTWPDASPDTLGMAAGALEYLAAVKHLQQGDLVSAIVGLHPVPGWCAEPKQTQFPRPYIASPSSTASLHLSAHARSRR